MMKKHLHNSLRALFLSLAVLLSLPVLAVKVEIDGINYDLVSRLKQATVMKKSSGKYSGEVVIPESVEHEGTTYSVKSIWDEAFRLCDGLSSVTIPNSVTSIGRNAFYECSGLTSITIGNSVESIGNYAFYECSGLTSVTIPNSVTSIGDGAFTSCYGLTEMKVDANNPKYDSREGCNAIIETSSNTLISGCQTTVIPNSVMSIGDRAFSGCSCLTSVTIGNSVESIGNYAFYECSGLTSVTIGNSVTSIGDYAFYKCSGLTSITIPNSVTSIGWYAFRDCTELLDVYCYAENVPFTESNAFDGSYPENATLYVPAASINSYEASAPWNDFGNIVAITTEVNGINYDFNADTKEATVIKKSRGKYSDEVIIPESVEYGGDAYSVTSIGGQAFRGCSGLTSVTIPNSVTSIGEGAFDGCFGLTSVTISNGVESIGEFAFYGCSGLTSVTIGNSVTSIGYGAFYDCSGLTSVTIPNNVTSIGKSAFEGCTGLTSVTIPNSVTSIGEYAFANCSKLHDVYCYAEEVPSTESNTFEGSSIGTATLHVPAGSIERYNATAPWNDFGTITPLLEDLTLADGEEFENNTEECFATLTYTRTLPNMLWNALYVPFEIPVSEIIDKYEVAYVNNINSYDHNDDGTIDDMRMEVIKIKSGTLNANYPYLIKARNEEAKNMTITLENTTLFQSVETTIDCSSVFAKHEITGIYNKRYKNELPDGAMAISMAGAWQPIASGSYLNPFRLYMTITARDGSPVKVEPAAMSRIRISVLGEDVETDIEETRSETKNIILDLSGRSVQNPVKGGVYIVNGKKVIF